MTSPTREQRLVRALLVATQTALRVRRIEKTDADVRDEADAALQSAFAPIWESLSHLELFITPEGLEFDDFIVLARGEDGEGLISSLDGSRVRCLALVPGAELEEIKVVLTAVAASRRSSGKQSVDLLTSLFRADLHHVQYELGDSRADRSTAASSMGHWPDRTPPPRIASSKPDLSRVPELTRDAVRLDASAAAPTAGVVRLDDFDSTLYFLEEREIEYLRASIDHEYAQYLALNTLCILLDILTLRTEPTVRDEVIGILSDLLPELLAAAKFEVVAGLVSGVREVTRDAKGLSEIQKESLDRLRASISHPRAVSQLLHALEAGGIEPTTESMGILLRELRPGAVQQVLAWSDQLSDLGVRNAVVVALDFFFTEWPHSLVRMVTAPRARRRASRSTPGRKTQAPRFRRHRRSGGKTPRGSGSAAGCRNPRLHRHRGFVSAADQHGRRHRS